MVFFFFFFCVFFFNDTATTEIYTLSLHDALPICGDWQRVTLTGLDLSGSNTPGAGEQVEILALDAALHELAHLSQRQARIVELRFFAGLTVDEAAAVLGVSPRTVELDWRTARAWLRDRLAGGEGHA